MIYSMTGFGRTTKKSKYGTINVEIKSLNHKFFEPSIKLPNGLAGFEDRVKSLLQKKVKRGKIYLNVSFEDTLKEMDKISINLDMARAYRRQIRGLKKNLALKGDIKLEQFITLPGVITYEAPRVESSRIWTHVRKALDEAIEHLIKERGKEGRVLHKDLSKRAREIKTLLTHISQRSNINVANYKKHLSQRIKELTGTQLVDKGRLEQEVALFAKNCDISEELTRLKSHISVFEESLKSDQEAGKKLDFIAQELHREINTIGAKASDFKISRWVIQVKSEIEKIREQVKNVQ